ncbi:hypothetical protein [Ponticaulis profundi]|uniref:Uncharacterized protein n=1 Tax=Ponticaulis profundi TaxID=2665222 RepID=A0ABW1S8T2_9PROT
MADLATLLSRLSTVDENTGREELAELGAQVLTLVSGAYHFPSPIGPIRKNETRSGGQKVNNPVTDLNAVKALEREYAPAQWTLESARLTKWTDGSEWVGADSYYHAGIKTASEEYSYIDTFWSEAETEEAARCMALLKAREAQEK